MHQIPTTTTDIVLSRAIAREGEIRLIRVPNMVYQIMCDIAAQFDHVQNRQKRVFTVLTDWLHENRPSYGLLQFEDFNEKDAERMNEKLAARGQQYRIQWGMYLLIGAGMKDLQMSTSMEAILDRPNDAIEDGQHLLVQ